MQTLATLSIPTCLALVETLLAKAEAQHAAGDMYAHLIFLLISWIQFLQVLFRNVKVILHVGRHFGLLVKGFYMGFRLPAKMIGCSR